MSQFNFSDIIRFIVFFIFVAGLGIAVFNSSFEPPKVWKYSIGETVVLKSGIEGVVIDQWSHDGEYRIAYKNTLGERRWDDVAEFEIKEAK